MRFHRLLAVFLASLMLFSFASCSNTPENRTGSLNIHVSDTVSKVIGYDAEENGYDRMSHYSIQVLDQRASATRLPSSAGWSLAKSLCFSPVTIIARNIQQMGSGR